MSGNIPKAQKVDPSPAHKTKPLNPWWREGLGRHKRNINGKPNTRALVSYEQQPGKPTVKIITDLIKKCAEDSAKKPQKKEKNEQNIKKQLAQIGKDMRSGKIDKISAEDLINLLNLDGLKVLDIVHEVVCLINILLPAHFEAPSSVATEVKTDEENIDAPLAQESDWPLTVEDILKINNIDHRRYIIRHLIIRAQSERPVEEIIRRLEYITYNSSTSSIINISPWHKYIDADKKRPVESTMQSMITSEIINYRLKKHDDLNSCISQLEKIQPAIKDKIFPNDFMELIINRLEKVTQLYSNDPTAEAIRILQLLPKFSTYWIVGYKGERQYPYCRENIVSLLRKRKIIKDSISADDFERLMPELNISDQENLLKFVDGTLTYEAIMRMQAQLTKISEKSLFLKAAIKRLDELGKGISSEQFKAMKASSKDLQTVYFLMCVVWHLDQFNTDNIITAMNEAIENDGITNPDKEKEKRYAILNAFTAKLNQHKQKISDNDLLRLCTAAYSNDPKRILSYEEIKDVIEAMYPLNITQVIDNLFWKEMSMAPVNTSNEDITVNKENVHNALEKIIVHLNKLMNDKAQCEFK